MQPYQEDVLNKFKGGVKAGEMTIFSAGRHKLFKNFMEKPASRFIPYDLHHTHGLMIQDYMWWTENEREILNWMAANLSNGIDHQLGMTITFDTEQDRTMFLLRWA